MASYEIRPLQLRMLEVLCAIDQVFKKHNLRYYIIEGTLLGAIRHKGFIPWDDDIDIGVPREDYEILIENASNWLPYPYELICAENDKNYPLPFAKIQDVNTTLIDRASFKYVGGVYVDIFPLDGMSDNKIVQSIHFLKYHLYNKILYFTFRNPYKHGRGMRSWMPLFFQMLFKSRSMQRRIKKLQMEYNYNNSNHIINHDDGKRGVMPKSILGTPTQVLFENKEFTGAEQYDAYLKHIYGDYMKIPPVDEQRQHNFHYLDLEHPYREYSQEDNLK